VGGALSPPAQPSREVPVATDTQHRAMRMIDLMLERVEATKYPSKDLLDRLERSIVLFWEEERTEESA
jgi:hypothetical protein